MPTPSPNTTLTDHCSVVYDETLYVYSPDAFQSISLKENATWSTLENGVSASGAVCVKAIPEEDASQAALYVVGGEADASLDYPGLQKYTFSTKKWETITPTDTITENRQNHGATYLNSTGQILVYAGSQTSGDTGTSSGTFLINTSYPYSVDSYSSQGAPNVYAPFVLPWNDSHAVMFGGGSDNLQIWTYGLEDGWTNLGVELTAAITNQSTTKCTIVSGDDGSKVLEQYDLGASPNEVTRIALLGADGVVASTGEAVGAKKRKRDLTIDDWPSYNDTDAPTTTRSGYSIAQDEQGRAVISGGTTDDDDDSLAIFSERENTWVNATQFFTGQVSSSVHSSSVSSSASSSLSSSTSTSSSDAAASSTAAAAATSDSDSKSRMLTVLGATLGTIFGIALFLVIILLLLRWKREKQKKAGGQGDEKDRMSFVDRGVSHAGLPAPGYPQSMNGSQSSLAIISGKYGGSNSNHKRGLPSDASIAGLVSKTAPIAYNDPVEMSKIGDMKTPAYTTTEKSVPSAPAPVANPSSLSKETSAGSRSRSSGWSRYFANNDATNISKEPYDRSTYASNNSRYSDMSMSEYTNSRIMSQGPMKSLNRPSQTLPPLDVSFVNHAFDGNRLSRVATGSPTIGDSRSDLAHSPLAARPMQAELARANSVSTVSSLDFHEDGSSLSREEETTGWTPVGPGAAWNSRIPSSVYPDSRPVSEFQHNDATSSYYPQDGASSFYPKSNTTSLYPPSLHPNPIPNNAAAVGRDSTVTVFPRGVPSTVPDETERQKQLGKQDMSWLKF